MTPPNEISETRPKSANLFRRELWFLLLFASIYALFHIAYMAIPDSVLRNVVYFQGITSICANVIDVITPAEGVTAISNKLVSSRAALEIVRGCDGSGATFLLIAAILAFPAGLKHKLVGLILGLMLMYAINLVRIVVLYFVSAYRESWFLTIHTYFAPTLIIVVCCIFFLWWALWSKMPADERAATA